MKAELQYIGNKIIENKQSIVKDLRKFQDNNLDKSQHTHRYIPIEKATKWQEELLQFLGEALIQKNLSNLEHIENWAKQTSKETIEIGVKLDKIAETISHFRTIIWNVFTEELEEQKFAAITMLDVSKIINPILDKVVNILSQQYVQYNKFVIESAHSTLQELSAPVVPISDGVAVLPLVGEIDSNRADYIMKKTLSSSNELLLDYLIIDLSGVSSINTHISHYIVQLVHALKVVGVSTTLTGIRPEIAQTVVSLGANLVQVSTKSNLKQALEEIGFKREIKNPAP